MSTPAILGLDIAKATFQVSLRYADQVAGGQFDNHQAGYKKLSAWLKKRKVPTVWACLEATGRYGEPLADYLHAQGHTVSVVNPLAVKRYAQSQLLRNKTDAVDAALIADFCATQRPPVWSPPAPELRELRELLHHHDTLKASRQRAVNRLAAGLRSAAVRAQLQDHLDFLDEQLADLAQQIDDHLEAHPALQREHELLDSIPGIGSITAAKMVAADLSRFEDAGSAAAHAGLTPMNRTSGSSVHHRPRLSKVGQASLRQALFFPAIVASRLPAFQPFYQRLLAKGKPKMAAICALMHKLLRVAYGVLKSGRPFDPNHAAQFQFTP